jgi:hypothetical protein
MKGDAQQPALASVANPSGNIEERLQRSRRIEPDDPARLQGDLEMARAVPHVHDGHRMVKLQRDGAYPQGKTFQGFGRQQRRRSQQA